MLELIDALAGRRTLESIAGLSYRRGRQTVHNPPRQRCRDMDAMPVPDVSLIAGAEKLHATPIVTSLGCPYACNFCSVTAMFGRSYRHRSPEHVMAEIRAKRPRSIAFYDDNFVADRRRAKTLLRMMIADGRTVPWSGQVRADVAKDPELVDLMRRSGCERLAIGFESVNQATLDGYEKSQSVEDAARAIDILHDNGIATHGMFVLGADTDSVATIRDTITFARRHGIDTLMLNILTPLPGTTLHADLEASGRIFTRDWGLYDVQHVVYRPARMTARTLQRETLRAYARYYSPREGATHLAHGRFGQAALTAWYWWFAHKWSREPGNRAYLRMLDEAPAA
jgi:anaerobic magnesium-protoporphyrin IX monomethyl ester cyclase